MCMTRNKWYNICFKQSHKTQIYNEKFTEKYTHTVEGGDISGLLHNDKGYILFVGEERRIHFGNGRINS